MSSRGRRNANPYFNHQNYDGGNNRGWTHGTSGDNRGDRGKSVDERGRGGRGRGRGRGGRSGFNQGRGYDRQQHGNFERNRVEYDMNNDRDEENNAGFQKFRDPNASAVKGKEYERNTNRFNTGNSWNRNNQPKYLEGAESSKDLNKPQTEEHAEKPKRISQSSEIPPVEPKILHKIKIEKVQKENSTKTDNGKARKPAEQSSSSSDSSSEDEKTPAAKVKEAKEKQQPVKKIKIKKEKETTPPPKKKTASAPPTPAPLPKAAATESSSDSSSEDSSSGEEEIPNMPQPIKSSEGVKLKKERTAGDDVVCLGKINNIENLVDKDESGEAMPCIVCKKEDHTALECQMPCKKCTHTGYECQMVCKNCGETYTNNLPSLPKPPNPFVMFMQFMQFCMSQYYTSNGDIKFPFPQCNVPVPNPAPSVAQEPSTAEVTRKDIETSKKKRKKSKTESKQKRKKLRKDSVKMSEDDSDSGSSSEAMSAAKKRKKHAKNIIREKESTPHQEMHIPPPFGQFHTSTPFVGGFNAPGYNPMLAFNSMMGFNPPAMNFQR